MKGHDLAHGHTLVVGIVGLAVGTVLLFVFPSLKAVSGMILLQGIRREANRNLEGRTGWLR